MMWRLMVGNGLLLGGIAAMCAIGTDYDASRLIAVSAPQAAALARLEAEVAACPTAHLVIDLASAYLETNQPGLASAVIEGAPREVRAQPEVAQTYARTLYGRALPRQALAVARDARDVCADDAACPTWVLAKATRQVAFLSEIVAAGIDDPSENPEATMAAYTRSSHEVRLVAMR
jgi:hypothetical protein